MSPAARSQIHGRNRGRVRLRAGFLEFQTVFDRNAYANREDVQFMNAALDNDVLVPLPNALGGALILRPWPFLEPRSARAMPTTLDRHRALRPHHPATLADRDARPPVRRGAGRHADGGGRGGVPVRIRVSF